MIKECLSILNTDCNIEEIPGKLKAKIAELKEKTNKEQNSEESQAIKYLLDKKCSTSAELVKKLLLYTNNRERENQKGIA